MAAGFFRFFFFLCKNRFFRFFFTTSNTRRLAVVGIRFRRYTHTTRSGQTTDRLRRTDGTRANAAGRDCPRRKRPIKTRRDGCPICVCVCVSDLCVCSTRNAPCCSSLAQKRPIRRRPANESPRCSRLTPRKRARAREPLSR